MQSRLSIILTLCAAWFTFATPQPARACTGPCTKTQITSDIAANWPDNTIGSITPALLRSTVSELLNSYLDVNGSSSFACTTHQVINSILTLSTYNCIQLGVSDLSTATTGSGSIVLGTGATIGTPAISGGTIASAAVTSSTVDSTPIGATTPAAGTFTTVKIPNAYGLRWNACVTGINFNSANTDNALPITLPAGTTAYTIAGVRISSASASISTATVGIFTTTGGGGTAIASNQAITVTTASANTNNNTQSLTINNPTTIAFNLTGATALQIRIGTAEGSTATANVCVEMVALP